MSDFESEEKQEESHSDELPHVEIYTDGGCTPNPGPGGWGVLLRFPAKDYEKELSGGIADTTNNRMELTAALQGLKALKKRCQVDFYTDSQYLRNGITNWVDGWIKKGMLTESGGTVSNADLWWQLYQMRDKHDITWHWVKGHAGDEYNERVHGLASKATPRQDIQVDVNAIRIYLKLSASQKRGPRGWAVSIIQGDRIDNVYGGHPNATQNHFALLATLAALNNPLIAEADKKARIQFFLTSGFVYNGITTWIKGWRKQNWERDIKFKEDWQTLDKITLSHRIQWVIVRGEEPDEMKALKGLLEKGEREAKLAHYPIKNPFFNSRLLVPGKPPGVSVNLPFENE